MPKNLSKKQDDLTEIKNLIIAQNKRIDGLAEKIKVLENNKYSNDSLPVNNKSQPIDSAGGIFIGSKSKDSKDSTTGAGSTDHQEIKTKSSHDVPKENSTGVFKVFGSLGVLLILMGIMYFYKYAIANEWIGITGRVVIGVIVSLIFVLTGLFFYKKDYQKFSQLLTVVGLGTLYFTIFATYHFRSYRNALGMTLFLNSLLLVIVMIIGLIIGLRLNKKFVVIVSFLLGYLAAFLSGIDGSSIQMMIFVLFIDIVFLTIAKMKAWFGGLYIQILTYVAYVFWLSNSLFYKSGYLYNLKHPVITGFIFLSAIYFLFTIYSFIQVSKTKGVEGVGLNITNSLALGLFSIVVIIKYSELGGLYLIFAAAIMLLVGYFAKKKGLDTIFSIEFLLMVVTIAIAIPVQFDYAVVTLLWVLVLSGLLLMGKKMQNKRLYLMGLLGYFLPIIRVLAFDFWLNSDLNRIISVTSMFAGLLFLLSLKFLDEQKDEFNKGLFSAVGNIMGLMWLIIEVGNFFNSNTSMYISIFGAIYAIATIAYGIILKKKLMNWLGIITFMLVILKVLFYDISYLSNISRVVVLMLVGLLALLGSWFFVKNKDKIKEEFI